MKTIDMLQIKGDNTWVMVTAHIPESTPPHEEECVARRFLREKLGPAIFVRCPPSDATCDVERIVMKAELSFVPNSITVGTEFEQISGAVKHGNQLLERSLCDLRIDRVLP